VTGVNDERAANDEGQRAAPRDFRRARTAGMT
jgi:hypothetical protein